MVRITKEPEERRNELIKAAEEIFRAKGFEKTLVSDIVKSVGVAQGTFYYYFKSKDEVLIAIIDNVWHEMAAGVAEILGNKELDPFQKLHNVFAQLFKTEGVGDERLGTFLNMGEESSKAKFHNHSDGARIKYFGPIIQQLVRDGIAAGVFNKMQNPDEITEIIFMGVNTYMHTYFSYFSDRELFKRKMSALGELFEKILGLKKGSFKLTD